ncbi:MULTISPECIES: carbohydrate ABC transporter permease [Caproicibacterium]|uniref:Carbohydrate ABC transporter permease n=1 Tax=Caproicibacterium argilliputei TaxID=3030016 RepID=A0AA97DA56_9FIRM|nr:carbohydrate ABC transporter permease [Caproicibacterium argilliputei]WOC31641.1 carbohydrate ABC transporter permease [Caproicibacterium argilliputei]
MIVQKRKDVRVLNVIAYVVTALVALTCLIPFLMVLAASFSNEQDILNNGFSLLPQGFTVDAYKTVFKEPVVIFRAYGVTIFVTLFGTALGLFLTAMTAYVLQRKDFPWRNKFSFFFYFTSIFSGGLVPYYILMINGLKLQNSYLALILPLLFNVFNLLLMKSYLSGIPMALTEAARIDGCGDFTIFIRIILPMAKPALATVGLFMALAYWNDWYNAMLYVNDEKMFPLQYFLYQKVNNIEAYKRVIAQQGGSAAGAISMPTQSLKMALTVVVTGPIVLAYPFVQKYFVQGITVGAVKG